MVLLTTCCDLFEAIWATWNSMLHDNDPSADNLHGSQLNERLLQYKRKHLLWLNCIDRAYVDYPNEIIIGWTKTQKRSVLKILDSLKRVHARDLELQNKGQRSLNSYFEALPTPDAPT